MKESTIWLESQIVKLLLTSKKLIINVSSYSEKSRILKASLFSEMGSLILYFSLVLDLQNLMANCINGRKGYRFCISENCTEPAVLCRNEDCNCEDKHKNCRESLKVDLEIQELNSRLVFRNESTSKRLEEVLQRVIALPNAIPAGLIQWKAQVGLTSDQLRLLQQLTKSGNISLTGSAIHTIDFKTPLPPTQTQKLILSHLQNIQQMLISSEQALRILTTFSVENPISPSNIKLSPAFFVYNKKLNSTIEKQVEENNKIQNLQSKIKNFQCQILELTDYIQKLQTDQAIVKQVKRQLQIQLDSSHQTMSRKQFQISHLKKENADLESKLTQMIDIQAKNKRILDLDEQNHKNIELFKKQIQQLQIRKSEDQARIQSLKTELIKVNLVLTKTKQQNDKLRLNYVASEKILADLGVKIGNVNEKNGNDRQLAMKQEIQKLNNVIEALKTQKKKLFEENMKLQQEFQMMRVELHSLRNELTASKSKEIRSRQIEMENQKLNKVIRQLRLELQESQKSVFS